MKNKHEALVKELHRRADYALNSHSMNLTYETYGMAKMAYSLDGITWAEFLELNTKLVVKGLNDPAHCRLEAGV